MEISVLQLKKLSLAFRGASSRLLRSDYDEAMPNLRRFMNFIDSEDIIATFIAEHQQTNYDMESITSNRHWRNTFDIPEDPDDEIAFTYQLLKYGLEHFNDYQQFCMGYSHANRLTDWVKAFHSSVVSPFIGHINMYLNGLMIDAGADEGGVITVRVSGTGNQVNLAQGKASITASNRTIEHNDSLQRIDEVIVRLLKRLEETQMPKQQKLELQDTAEALQEEIHKEHPKRGFIMGMGRALKSIVGTMDKTVKVAGDVGEVLRDVNEIADMVSEIIP